MAVRGSGDMGGLVMLSADLERLEGCRDEILRLPRCAELYLSPILRIKLEKVGI